MLAGWALVLTSTVLGVAAHAQDAERLKMAAEEFDAGRRSYKAKDFEGAAVHFENADRDAPSADALFAAIRSRREAQQLARAATLAASGLVRYPQDKQLAEYANEVLGEADKVLHKVTITCQPQCTLVLDKKLVPPGTETTSATIYVDPGPHDIVAGWPGEKRSSKAVNAVVGGTTQLKLVVPSAVEKPAPAPTAKPPPVEAEPEQPAVPEKPKVTLETSSGLPPAVFLVGVGVTVVAGGVMIWSGLDTKSNPGPDKVRQQCQAAEPDCETLYNQGIAKQNRTNALIIGTAVAGVATGVIGAFFTNWGGSRAKSGSSLVPVVGYDNGMTVGALGRF